MVLLSVGPSSATEVPIQPTSNSYGHDVYTSFIIIFVLPSAWTFSDHVPQYR